MLIAPPYVKNWSAWSLGIVLAVLIASNGCGPKIVTSKASSASSAPSAVSQAIGSGTITFYRWDEKPTVMICSDIQGGSASLADSATSMPSKRKYHSKGSLSSQDGRRFEWSLEKKDGEKIKCRLNGNDFDLEKGNLFLVKTKGGETEIEQISQDISAVKLEIESIKAFARTEAAISNLLELADE